jgi:hypothetical protein
VERLAYLFVSVARPTAKLRAAVEEIRRRGVRVEGVRS